MSAKKLDKSKPHGVIYGDTEGRVYTQDGLYFKGDGTLHSEPAPAKKTAAAPAPAGDQLSQQLES